LTLTQRYYTAHILVMVALWNRTDHYIFILFLLSSFFSSPNLSGRRLDTCLPYFHTWCGLSANLECRSEMCCTWLAENTVCKKLPSGHHPTTSSGYIFATKACINNRKKNLLSSNISSRCPHNMVNFDPLVAEIVSGVWGTPATFVFRVLAACSSGHQPNFAALNIGRHLCSAGPPSCLALAHISSWSVSQLLIH